MNSLLITVRTTPCRQTNRKADREANMLDDQKEVNQILSNLLNKKAVLSQRWPRDALYISRLWAVAEIWPFEIIQDGGGRHLECVRTENSAIRSTRPRKPHNQTWSGSDDRLRRYGHFKFFQDGGDRHLGFVPTGNGAIRSAVPENPTLEQNMKWIGSPVAEIWPFAYVGAYGTPILGEGEVVGGQRWHH